MNRKWEPPAPRRSSKKTFGICGHRGEGLVYEQIETGIYCKLCYFIMSRWRGTDMEHIEFSPIQHLLNIREAPRPRIVSCKTLSRFRVKVHDRRNASAGSFNSPCMPTSHKSRSDNSSAYRSGFGSYIISGLCLNCGSSANHLSLFLVLSPLFFLKGK